MTLSRRVLFLMISIPPRVQRRRSARAPGRGALGLLWLLALLGASGVQAQARRLELDQVHNGLLTPQDSVWDGVYYDPFTIPCRAGESIRFTVRSSDFDAYLWALGPGMSTWVTDDDSAGGTDATIVLTPSSSGTCSISPSSYRQAVGQYRLVATIEYSTEDWLQSVIDRFDGTPVAAVAGELGSWGMDLKPLDLRAGIMHSFLLVLDGTDPPPSTLRLQLWGGYGRVDIWALEGESIADLTRLDVPGHFATGFRWIPDGTEFSESLLFAAHYPDGTPVGRTRRAALLVYAAP